MVEKSKGFDFTALQKTIQNLLPKKNDKPQAEEGSVNLQPISGKLDKLENKIESIEKKLKEEKVLEEKLLKEVEALRLKLNQVESEINEIKMQLDYLINLLKINK